MPRSKSASHSALTAAARWKITTAPASAAQPGPPGRDQLAELAAQHADPLVGGQVRRHRRLVGQGQPAERPGRAARHASEPAASRSRASRAPRNPAPPVITTFVTASPSPGLRQCDGVAIEPGPAAGSAAPGRGPGARRPRESGDRRHGRGQGAGGQAAGRGRGVRRAAPGPPRTTTASGSRSAPCGPRPGCCWASSTTTRPGRRRCTTSQVVTVLEDAAYEAALDGGPAGACFVLTNTRSLAEPAAAELTTQAARRPDHGGGTARHAGSSCSAGATRRCAAT